MAGLEQLSEAIETRKELRDKLTTQERDYNIFKQEYNSVARGLEAMFLKQENEQFAYKIKVLEEEIYNVTDYIEDCDI